MRKKKKKKKTGKKYLEPDSFLEFVSGFDNLVSGAVNGTIMRAPCILSSFSFVLLLYDLTWQDLKLTSPRLLWWNWFLYVFGIFGHLAIDWSRVPGTSIRHVVCPEQIIYSSCYLKNIWRSTFRSLLPADVWGSINGLGIRKPNQSQRAGRKKKKTKGQKLWSKLESVNYDLRDASNAIHIDYPNRVTRSPCSIPAMVYANIRQLLSKLDELQAISDNHDASFVCLTETWLYADISDSACALSEYTSFRKDRCFANCGGICIYVKLMHPCHLLPDFDDPQIEIGYRENVSCVKQGFITTRSQASNNLIVHAGGKISKNGEVSLSLVIGLVAW